jgi:hypothetical protein
MKKAFGSTLTLLASLVFASPSLAAHYQVYLLGGQSNANGRADATQLTAPLDAPQTNVRFYWNRTQAVTNVGWVLENQWTVLAPGTGHGTGTPVYPKEFGPEVSFGRAIAAAKPTANIAIIKYSHGGTNLSSNWSASGTQYTTFVSTVQTALAALTGAGHTYQLRGMLWQQGEADTSGTAADNYQTNLTSLIARVRTDLNGGAAFPFVIGSISNSQYGSAITTVGSGSYKVRQAQQAVAAADPTVGIVITDGYTTRPGDSIHFDHTAQITLGQSFSTAMMALETADTTGPQATSFAPADGNLGVAPNANFVITFNEPVAKGASGDIVIRFDFGSTSIFETIPITDSRVSVDGAVVTINPNGTLTPHDFNIQIAAGAIQDLSGNPWAGIANATTWNFAVALAATTTGIFDENTDATNAIDVQVEPNTLAPFQTAVLSAFTNDLGGVIDWETGTTVRSSSTTDPRNNVFHVDATYGAGAGKSLRVSFDRSMELYTNNINSQVLVLSRLGTAKSNALIPGGTTALGLEYNLTFNGAPVIELGAAMPSRNTYATSGVTAVNFRATVTFNSSAPVTRDFSIGGTPGTSDTFLHFTAPPGDTITGFGVKWISETGGTAPLTNGQRRPILDDLGFILAAPSSTYAAWIGGFFPGVTDPAIIGLNADPDGDGTDNGVENFFGTDPSAFTRGLVADDFTPGTHTLTATHPFTNTPASDLSNRYQWSPNLVDWYTGDGVDGPAGGPTATTASHVFGTTATVTATASAAMQRFFLRVSVKQD